MMRTIALALACAGMVVAAAPVPAAAQSGRILKSMTTQDLSLAMEAIGGSATLNDSAQGGLSMRLDFANGVTAIAQFSCNNTDGCTGLQLIAYFTRDEAMSIAQAQDRTRRYDWARAAVAAGLDDQNNMFISRYLILDGGIAYDNLITNLQVFESLCAEFATF